MNKWIQGAANAGERMTRPPTERAVQLMFATILVLILGVYLIAKFWK